MARVNQIEAAIGHHNALTRRTQILQNACQARLCKHIASSTCRRRIDGREQLFGGNTCRTQFRDHHPCGMVREVRRVTHRQPCTQAPRHYRDHGVAGTCDIKHLAGTGREMRRRLPRLNERHARLTPRYEDALEIQRLPERLSLVNQGLVCVAAPNDRFELGEIRGQQSGSPIALKIRAFGVYQCWLIQLMAMLQ